MAVVYVTAGIGAQATVVDVRERRGRRPAIGPQLVVQRQRFRLVAATVDRNGDVARAEYEAD